MTDLKHQSVVLLMLYKKISQLGFIKHSAPRLAHLDTFPEMVFIEIGKQQIGLVRGAVCG